MRTSEGRYSSTAPFFFPFACTPMFPAGAAGRVQVQQTRPVATTIGPTTTPSSPKTLMPPSTLMNTTRPPISARPLITQGRTTIVHQSHDRRCKIPPARCPAPMWPSHDQIDRRRRPNQRRSHHRNQREKSHHHAPEHRRGDSRRGQKRVRPGRRAPRRPPRWRPRSQKSDRALRCIIRSRCTASNGNISRTRAMKDSPSR